MRHVDWRPVDRPHFCHCGAYWQCEHRTRWSPRTVEGPGPGELQRLDDRARAMRKTLPAEEQREVSVNRCQVCTQWEVLLGGICGTCFDDMRDRLKAKVAELEHEAVAK